MAGADDRTDERAGAVRSFLADHPGSSRSEVAAATGVSVASVVQLLGDDAGRLLVTASTQDSSFSDADVLAALQITASELGEPLSAEHYDARARNRERPSSVRIVQRFGSWNAACQAAGLRVNAGRANYRRAWTREQLVAAVADYLESPGSRGSYAGYQAWAKGADGKPSGQTVRNVLGAWAAAKSAALVEVRARG